MKNILSALDGHKFQLGVLFEYGPDAVNRLVDFLNALVPVFQAFHMDGAVAGTAKAVGALLMVVGGAHKVWKILSQILKDSPPPPPAPAVAGILALLMLAPQSARAQDLGTYLKGHASILAGVAVIDHQAEKLIEIRLSDRFDFGGCWKGGYRAALFSVARAGEIQPTGLPATAEDLKAYSDGEVWAFGSCNLSEVFAVEGIAGVAFKTASLAGPNVDPLDGTKLAGLIGAKVGKNGYEFGIAGGHYGPVVDMGKVAGFLPSIVAHARLPMGAKATIVGEAAFGRLHDGTLTQSYRTGIETKF